MKILSMPAGASGTPSPVYYIGAGGTGSFTINIPATAKYLLTWNGQNNGDVPTVTNCLYVATKTVADYDFNAVPSANRPVLDRNIRVFEVGSTGTQTVTQTGATYIGYLTSSVY